ncbi:AAA domain-containing protein [Streptomyces sp. NBC_00988]|uniref:AAA domain-containing protein n=1 Tax=Streptomyces sp. NBC_00988 TaxID=2903704 RepID=UPI00386CF805|nr:AAA domain-containing protein [Streptomyces sp. NBC_00988]
MAAAETDRLVEYFFCDPQTALGRYGTPAGRSVAECGHELIAGALHRYDLIDGGQFPVTLQLYRGLDNFVGHLWEQEVRVLLRAAALRHPALPEIVTGGYRDAEATRSTGFDVSGFAYVVTKGAVDSLADGGLLDELRIQHAVAVRQFFFLSDALSVLHGQKIVHRNLWPGSIDVHQDTSMPVGPERLQLRLSRFEMSALIGNLLRATEMDTEHTAEQVTRLLLGQDTEALAYCAPERLAYLFPEQGTEPADHASSDVFSLGATVAEWFLPEKPGPAAPSGPGQENLLAWALKRHAALRAALDDQPDLPDPLRELLTDMLAHHHAQRPTSYEVVERISRHYEEISGYWAEVSDVQRPYLVAFLPAESRHTLYHWGWLTHDPETEEGHRELAELIEQDLCGARLVHAPHGAVPYVAPGAKETKREAQLLLIGTRAAWFCQRYRPFSALGTALGPPREDTLVIKYTVALDSSAGRSIKDDVDRTRFHRTIPSVDAVAYNIHPAEFAREQAGRPKWTPLIDAIARAVVDSPTDLIYEQAFDWLLSYQEVELQAREYAYEIDKDDHGGRYLTLRLDAARDDARRYRNSMLSHYCEDPVLRPPLGDFFASFASEEGGDIEVLDDRNGAPRRHRDRRFLVSLDDQLGEQAIRVRLHSDSGRPADRGWIRPAGDLGSVVAYRRQLHARWKLLGNKVLLQQLQHPTTIRGLPERWKDAGAGLVGGEVVTDMLVSQPFFALQGPPGTGKTEMTARAVVAYLRQEPAARVMVSAQSNWALDNLAARILERLAPEHDDEQAGGTPQAQPESDALDALTVGDVIALRVTTSSSADRVDDRLRPFRPAELAEARSEALQKYAAKEQKEAGRDSREYQLIKDWEAVSKGAVPELTDRIRRSANLVFATCSSADPEHMSIISNDEPFDWVLIEEAAKAWPTEIAIPLSQGLRWTLIGDHHQLPAHRRQDVERFLHDSADHPDPALALHGSRSAEYLRVFNMFGSLFEVPAADTDRGDGYLSRPVRTLNTQFRMNRPIGDLISRVFYPDPADPAGEGLIRTGKPDEPHGYSAPEWLGDASLIWLDTHALTGCEDEPAWKNRGEVEVVAELVSRLSPRPRPRRDGIGHDALAVLTPYRHQTDLLRARSDLAPFVRTVHAYQGREAEVVIVSLVRDRNRSEARDQPWKNLGHLVQPDLVNVMCSRARRLLIMVGDIEHFADSGVEFWPRVCNAFRRHGRVLPAGQAFRD